MLFDKISKHYGGNLAGKTFAIWGLAFKPGTDDMREAPSRVLLEAVVEGGREGARLRSGRGEGSASASGAIAPISRCATRAREALDGADALVIVTEWKEFRSPDFDHLKKQLKAPVIFDGRNLYDPVVDEEAGIHVLRDRAWRGGRRASSDAAGDLFGDLRAAGRGRGGARRALGKRWCSAARFSADSQAVNGLRTITPP